MLTMKLGLSSKNNGGVISGNDACNNIKRGNADNKIRVTLPESDISFRGKVGRAFQQI